MDIPEKIKKILIKEACSYDELRYSIMHAIKEVDESVSEINLKLLALPVELSNNELFDLLEYFYLVEYDEGVYIEFYDKFNTVLVTRDKHYGEFMLILITMLSIATIIFLIIILG